MEISTAWHAHGYGYPTASTENPPAFPTTFSQEQP